LNAETGAILYFSCREHNKVTWTLAVQAKTSFEGQNRRTKGWWGLTRQPLK
jgi:hypothetical protein